jgi:hypothetical protein
MECNHRSSDGLCKLQRGYCGLLDWIFCVYEDREFTIIIIVLVLLCLSAIGMLEMVEGGWIDF